jgi:sirohydrochlorin cobaltochelatase
MKTIVVLAAHGAPATDCPRRKIGMLMALESMQGLTRRLSFLRTQQKALDHEVRSWKRTADNDPYKKGVDALAEAIAAHTGFDVLAGYNEFCSPTVGSAIDEAVARGAARVIVATTMTTRGGEHSEIEIRDIVDEAQKRHPNVRICYAWPFDPNRVAQLYSEEIKNFARLEFDERAVQ